MGSSCGRGLLALAPWEAAPPPRPPVLRLHWLRRRCLRQCCSRDLCRLERHVGSPGSPHVHPPCSQTTVHDACADAALSQPSAPLCSGRHTHRPETCYDYRQETPATRCFLSIEQGQLYTCCIDRVSHSAGKGLQNAALPTPSPKKAQNPRLRGSPGLPGARSGENTMRSCSAAAKAPSAAAAGAAPPGASGGAITGAGRRASARRAWRRLTSTGVRIRLRARRCPASSGPDCQNRNILSLQCVVQQGWTCEPVLHQHIAGSNEKVYVFLVENLQ